MKTVFAVIVSCLGIVYVHAQNVGIGTATPTAKLDVRHVSSLSSPTLNLYDSNASNYSRLQFQNAGTTKYWHIAGHLDNLKDINSKLNFYSSVYGDVMTLTGDGKVGIGNSSPAAKLDVGGNVKATTYQYTVPRIFYYSLSGTDFTAGATKYNDVYKDGLATSSLSSSGVFCNGKDLLAPIHLPHSATVTGITVYYMDTSVEELQVRLQSYNPATDIRTTMAQLTSSGKPGHSSMSTATITDNLIDNQQKNYIIAASMSSLNNWPYWDIVIKGITISYTMSEVQ